MLLHFPAWKEKKSIMIPDNIFSSFPWRTATSYWCCEVDKNKLVIILFHCCHCVKYFYMLFCEIFVLPNFYFKVMLFFIHLFGNCLSLRVLWSCRYWLEFSSRQDCHDMKSIPNYGHKCLIIHKLSFCFNFCELCNSRVNW